MRTHGWAGSVPIDDAEATARILAAARSAIDEHGVATTISDVARTLGVTRQTVYRYFPSTEALLRATALDAVGAFLERIALRVSGIREPDAAVVEGIDVVLQELPDDRYIVHRSQLLHNRARVLSALGGLRARLRLPV